MKVLFITATRHNEPLGVMQLSACLKAAGHTVEGCMIEQEDAAAAVDAFRPDIVGYSMMSCEYVRLRDLNRDLKRQFSFFSIAGGPHPTYEPAMLAGSGFDAICVGEGEDAMVELAGALSDGKDPSGIANLHVETSGQIRSSPARPLIGDLDGIPHVDRDLFARYVDPQVLNLMASRGCPYQCTYCSVPAYTRMFADKDTKMRYRSIDDLAREVEAVTRRHGRAPDLLYFHDDLLVWNPRQITEWTREYKEKVGIPYTCSMRPNVFTPEIAAVLAESRCAAVYLGVEAGSDEVRRRILNRRIGREVLVEACQTFQRLGIATFAQNIIGVPRSTFDDDLETLRLNIDCQPHYAWASIYTPFPATPLAIAAVEEKLVPPDYVQHMHETFHYRTMLAFPRERREAIDRLHKLFAIGSHFPSTFDKVRQLATTEVALDLDALRRLYYSFRKWREDLVRGVQAPCPADVERFVALPVSDLLAQYRERRSHPERGEPVAASPAAT